MVGILALGVTLGAGCSKAEHPPAYQASTKSVSDAGTDGGVQITVTGSDASTPPSPDAAGLCGNQFLPLTSTRNNLYLVLDRSGSMKDPIMDSASGVSIKKYAAALRAIHDVLFALGHRLSYGAAVFPWFGVTGSCDPGDEAYPMTAGDSVTWAVAGKDGPNLTALIHKLDSWLPEGSTPTSATLEKLVERLIALGSGTSVILATDGAPNCNEGITCDIAHCIPNIEKWPLTPDQYCGASFNCCDPQIVVGSGGGNCIDADATVAPVAELLTYGIKTYVIGLPGSEAYEDVLNRLAIAGGTARGTLGTTTPAYYPVADAAELTASLKGIAAALAISCTVALDSAPPDWTQVNVYFDNQLIKMNVDNGWKQVDANTIEITGSYCEVLKSGDVFQVQVVSGCPTEVLI